MPRLWKVALLLLALVLLAVAGYAGYIWRAGDVPPTSTPVEVVSLEVNDTACRDSKNACRATHPELGEIQLRFPHGAYYMQRFAAELRLSDAIRVEQVRLDLTMTDMEMGRNRFALSPAGDGLWRGELLLPICVTGRVDWQVTVQMDSAGRRYVAQFPLMVSQPPSKSD